MTIYAGHLRELVLLLAAIVIFADSPNLSPVLEVLAIGFTSMVIVFHLGHLYRAVRYPEKVEYVG